MDFESFTINNNTVYKPKKSNWVRIHISPESYVFNEFIKKFQEGCNKKLNEIEFRMVDNFRSEIAGEPVFMIFKIVVNKVEEEVFSAELFKKRDINEF